MKRKRRRWILVTLAALVIIPALVASVVLGPYAIRAEHFRADPKAGYHADFFLYVSPGARQWAARGQPVTLLVQPNNSGTNSDDASVHRKDAWWSGFGRHGIADDLEVVLLVPAFVRPARDWQIYTHALDRDTITTQREDLRRPDMQLLRMLDAAEIHLAEQGLIVDSKILIQGYSASGMFANRFAMLHPDRVKGVSAGSPGGWPIVPVAEYQGQALNYPAGVGDLPSLTGAAFDAAALQGVPQLIVMGDLDDNDSLDFGDGWDEEAARQIDELFGETPIERWDHARQIYEQAGMDATFLLVPGVGHDRRALQSHSTEFFRALLALERSDR